MRVEEFDDSNGTWGWGVKGSGCYGFLSLILLFLPLLFLPFSEKENQRFIDFLFSLYMGYKFLFLPIETQNSYVPRWGSLLLALSHFVF